MRKLKFFFALFVLALLTAGNTASGQTYHHELTAEFDGLVVWCLNRPCSGSLTYNFTYHVDKKTGYIDRIHWNVKESDLYDTETLEKYIIVDTGNDNAGAMWDFFNNIVSYTGVPYNVGDGWLPVPPQLPAEGIWVTMGFRLIARGGESYYLSTMAKLNYNANGILVVDFYKERLFCN